MAQNNLMHPRNIYKTPPDFKQLAIEYTEFRMHAIQDLTGKVIINFKDPNALRALTCALLKKDFGLDVEIPADRLIPTVPQRLNYILWLEDLLKEDSAGNSVKRGVDIGTGASCVFPLLGSSKNGWHFVATESDQASYDCASRNVLKNNLQESVTVVRVTESSTLDSLLSDKNGNDFDFCMCNPPFFCDSFDASWESKARKRNREEPRGANTASPVETITEGGEVEFVKRIIADSLGIKKRIRIYTTMLGKKTSVSIIKEHLKEKGIPHFVTTEFQQGKTLRWGVAWTFCPEIKLSKISISKGCKSVKPLSFFVPSTLKCVEYSVPAVLSKIVDLLKALEIVYDIYEKKETRCKMWMRTNTNTWSHQRRKKRELMRQQKQAEHSENNHFVTENGSTSTNCTADVTTDRDLESKVASCEAATNKSIADVGSKRKRCMTDPESQEVAEDLSKTANTETQPSNSRNTCKEDTWLLFADIDLSLAGRCILLEVKARKQMDSRETLHQIMQYLKNNLV